MEPVIYGLLGGVVGIFLMLITTCVIGKMNEEIPEKRTRIQTRKNADKIGMAYRCEALTLSQAVLRLREIEVPVESINRILRTRVNAKVSGAGTASAGLPG